MTPRLILIASIALAPVAAFSPDGATAQRKTGPRMVARWDVQPTGVTDDLTAVCFVNEKEGWAREIKSLLHTTDGGDTWQAAARLPLRTDHGYGVGSAAGASWF